MKQLAIGLILLVSFCTVSGQASSDFNDLLEIFDRGHGTEIPDTLAKKYFDFTPNTDPHWGNKELFVNGIIFQNDKYYALSAASDCGAGGICEYADLRLFNKFGIVVSELKGFESAVASCSFGKYNTCRFSSDTLLIIVNERIEEDCMEDTVFSRNISIRKIHIKNNGEFTKGNREPIEVRRRYYKTSTQLLNSKDLEEFTKEELSIMRNEIFAAHGYRFKSSKWSNYFSKFAWYEPKYNDVNDKLTIIERLNIKSIVEQEKK